MENFKKEKEKIYENSSVSILTSKHNTKNESFSRITLPEWTMSLIEYMDYN